jgi:hypothetical protein
MAIGAAKLLIKGAQPKLGWADRQIRVFANVQLLLENEQLSLLNRRNNDLFLFESNSGKGWIWHTRST